MEQNNIGLRVSEIFELYGHVHTYSPGEIIFQKGDKADKIYFLSKGRVRTFCLNKHGDEITLFYVDENNTVGNEPVANIPQRKVSVAAVTDVKIYSMHSDTLLEKCRNDKLSMQSLMEYFVTKIISLSDYICCTRFLKNDKKLAYFLYTNCMGDGHLVQYTHEQIASLTGMNRVTVTRLLKNFEDKKLISQHYKGITVLDRCSLVEIFNSIGYFID